MQNILYFIYRVKNMAHSVYTKATCSKHLSFNTARHKHKVTNSQSEISKPFNDAEGSSMFPGPPCPNTRIFQRS